MEYCNCFQPWLHVGFIRGPVKKIFAQTLPQINEVILFGAGSEIFLLKILFS